MTVYDLHSSSSRSRANMKTLHHTRWGGLLMGALVLTTTGCTSLQYACDMPAIPAHRLPADVFGRPREDMVPISLSRLRQPPPDVYQLAAGDVLGIFIPFVLGKEDEAPPVHFPEDGSQLPSLGFPVPVREDGKLNLPLVDPIDVSGLSLAQATEVIRKTYVQAGILKEGSEKVVATLQRRRQIRVLVIREESGSKENVTKRGTGDIVDLPAYENDVLTALSRTGGLPGLDAQNEIFVIRGDYTDAAEFDTMVSQLGNCQGDPCDCKLPPPDAPNVVRIPIRFYPENPPTFTQDDIILNPGDIVYIPSRERDRYYTGGVLPGGDHLLPRDYDLDVIQAMAVSRGPLGSPGSGIGGLGGAQGGMGFGGGGGGGMRGGICQPSNLIVIRKLPCGGEIPILIDTNRALVDPSHRILVQPDDMLILRYKWYEEVANVAGSIFQINWLLGQGLNR
jgi:hypothetical protein